MFYRRRIVRIVLRVELLDGLKIDFGKEDFEEIHPKIKMIGRVSQEVSGQVVINGRRIYFHLTDKVLIPFADEGKHFTIRPGSECKHVHIFQFEDGICL